MSRIVNSPNHIEGPSGASPYPRIIAFFLICYAFSWWGYAIAFATGSSSWGQMFPLGPLAAAALMAAATGGKAGLSAWWRRVSRIRGPVRYYAIALLIPVAIPFASAALTVSTGTAMPESTLWLSNVLPALALVIPVMFLFGPLGEEPGFRGWGQYNLQSSISPLKAALIIGVGVLVWHLPLFIGGDIPLAVTVALPAVSVVYAWLYQNSGTVWTAIVAHTAMNVVSGIYLGEVFDQQAAEMRLAFIAAFYVAWAAYLVWRYGSSLSKPAADVSRRTTTADLQLATAKQTR